MANLTMDQAIAKLREQNSPYSPAAYHFIRRALDHSLRKFQRGEEDRPAHVSGRQLLEGFRDLALSEFGPLAMTVLEEWGIHRCRQVGEMVFQLVSLGVLGKNDHDKVDDFEELWSFAEAFETPFLPKRVSGDPRKILARSNSPAAARTTRRRPAPASTPSPQK
jgi:uncharacterized repeat protein (TIGR04138 family)